MRRRSSSAPSGAATRSWRGRCGTWRTLERQDGIKRVWRVPWEQVAIDLPAYGERVRARIAQLGANHPFIKTEYCLEELDGEGGLFPAHRLAQLRGDHPRRHHAESGKRYALLIDVAGEEETGTGPLAFDDASRRDSTAVTVVEVERRATSLELREGNRSLGAW